MFKSDTGESPPPALQLDVWTFPLLLSEKQKLCYLFGHAVPLLVADAQVRALLVEELALLGDQEHVAHELAHCKKITRTKTHSLVVRAVGASSRCGRE